MIKIKPTRCSLWIVFCVIMYSIISTYISYAQNTPNSEKIKDAENESLENQVGNDGKSEGNVFKTVLVEVADPQLADDDDEENLTPSFILSVAPATPQIFFVSPSSEVFTKSVTDHDIEPCSHSLVQPIFSTAIAPNEMNKNQQAKLGEDSERERSDIEEGQNKEELFEEQIESLRIPMKFFLPADSSLNLKEGVAEDSLMEDSLQLDADQSITNVEDESNSKNYLNEEVEKNREFSEDKEHLGENILISQPPPTVPTPVSAGMVSVNDDIEDTTGNASSDGTDEVEKDKTGMLSFTEWKEKKKLNDLTKEQDEEEDIVDVSKLVAPKNKTSAKLKANKMKKNYASLQCGAKVVAANPEASNAVALLKEDKDVYMLNPCTVKAWFVVELCERIEIDSVDLANFEMFSSTPESFVVYVSSRYPTREWEAVGNFSGKPEKKTHNYVFEDQFYAKYLKLEVKKYYGKEHYCPLSLFRVYGTTEVEQIENDEEQHYETANHDESSTQHEKRAEDERNENIFTTAKKAVVNLVSDMANKLSGNSNQNEDGGDKETELNLTNIVTLLPENATFYADDDLDFISRCIKRTTVPNSNVSLNPHCQSRYIFAQQICPLSVPVVLRESLSEETPIANQVKRHAEVDSENKEEDNFVPPLPVPPIATRPNRSTPHKSSMDVVADNIVRESAAEENHDIAKTYRHKTTTCPKEDSTIDVRKLLEPTLQPSFIVDTATLSEATRSLSASSVALDASVETALKANTTTPETVATSIGTLVTGQAEKDLLEFKLNAGANDTNSVIAETVAAKLSIHEDQEISNNTERDVAGALDEIIGTSSLETSKSYEKHSTLSMNYHLSMPSLTDVSSIVNDIGSSTVMDTLDMNSSILPIAPTKTLSVIQTLITVEHTEQQSAVPTESLTAAASLLKATTGLSGSKESIIVKLNAKVKALQANLTMSMMYLEEMSERYRSAVEEVDKRHEQKIVALNVSLKVQQDMIDHQFALIGNLTNQINSLTKELQNLTTFSHEQDIRITERHYSWVLIEAVALFSILLLCRRTPKPSPAELQRRHSEPIMSSTPMSNGHLKRPRRTLSGVDSPIHRSRNMYEVETVEGSSHSYEESATTGPVKKKKRRRSKSAFDKPESPSLQVAEKTTGILFSAGNRVLNGITGALYGTAKMHAERPSRQADALIDEVTVSLTKRGHLRKTRSIDLPTINEVDCSKNSFTPINSVVDYKNLYGKTRNKLRKASSNGGRFA